MTDLIPHPTARSEPRAPGAGPRLGARPSPGPGSNPAADPGYGPHLPAGPSLGGPTQFGRPPMRDHVQASPWRGRRRRITDRVMTVAVSLAFVAALVPLVSLLGTVVAKGARAFSWTFLTTDMVGVFGDMTSGGVSHAIIGTLLITALATLIAVPLGLLTAIYLVEYGTGPLARAITFFVDVMTGIPSIVAGLFAFAACTLVMGPAYRSGLMGAFALALLMTPVVVRSAEQMLRLVPRDLREASYALGVPKWLTVIKVVLRTASGGIVTGVMLAIARVVGETAPVLVAVGMVTRTNWDVFEGRMATLPVFAYSQYQQGGAGIDRAWAAALTLILIVMALNLLARGIGRMLAPRAGR